MQGALRFPCSKDPGLVKHQHQQTSLQIRTLIEKNGTPASPATARASNVLPVPEDQPEEHPWEFLLQL